MDYPSYQPRSLLELERQLQRTQGSIEYYETDHFHMATHSLVLELQGGLTKPNPTKETLDHIQNLRKRLDVLEHEQMEARNAHARRARASTSRRKITDLPIEIIRRICEATQGTATGAASFQGFIYPDKRCSVEKCKPGDIDDAYYDSDIAAVKRMRLSCHLLKQASSHLLITRVTVYPHVGFIERLETISRHPLISQGVRQIRIRTRSYHPWLPTNSEEELLETRQNLAQHCHVYLRCQWHLRIGSLQEECNLARTETSQSIPESVSTQTAQLIHAFAEYPGHRAWPIAEDEGCPHSDRIRRFVIDCVDVLMENQSKCRIEEAEQKELILSRRFVHQVAEIASRFRNAARISLGHSTFGCETTVCGASRFRSNYQPSPKVLHDPSAFARRVQLQLSRALSVDEQPVTRSLEKEIGNLQMSLLHQLPRALPLEALHAHIIAPMGWSNNIKSEELCALQAASGGLKVLEIRVCRNALRYAVHQPDLFSFQSSSSIRHEDTDSFHAIIRALCSSPRLERFALKAGAPIDLGKIKPRGSKQMLQIRLDNCDIHFESLKAYLNTLDSGFELQLRKATLLSGSWIDVLDMLRGRVSTSSALLDVRGQEAVWQPDDPWDIIVLLSATFLPPWGPGMNKATMYVTGADLVNPVISLELQRKTAAKTSRVDWSD